MISPEVALLIEVCIEFPGWTNISAAAPIPEIDAKTRKAANKVINLFIPTPPFI
jgi:hypothetical protein